MFEARRSMTRSRSAFNMLGLIYHSIVREIRKDHRNAVVGLLMNMVQTIVFVAAFYFMFTFLGLKANSVRGDFTVNIAYVEEGAPRRGVVYAPAKGRLFYTNAAGVSVEEVGSLDKNTIGTTIPINVNTPDNTGLMVVASKSHRDQATDDYINKYSVNDMKSAGSSLKFCLVATGEADLYPRVGRTMEWDTAAGHAVLTGAGGHVVRFDDHMPLAYGKEDFANPFFIAYAPGIDLKLP